jgi:hypothetical protein
MSEPAAHSSASNPKFPSTSATVVCLFCLLGLAVTAAFVPMIPPSDLNWVLSHIE